MPTLGNTTAPTFGFDQRSSTGNQAAQLYTMPSPGGVITSVSFYGSGDGANHNTAYGCIWNSSGTLLASGSGVDTTGGSGTGGGQAWHTDTLTSPLFVAGGTQIYIGWQRSTANSFDWSYAGDGATSIHYATAGNTPSAFGTAIVLQNGSIGAYATYAVGIYVNTGTPSSPVWTPAPVYVNTGTPASPIWTPASGVFINTGTPASPVWTPSS